MIINLFDKNRMQSPKKVGTGYFVEETLKEMGYEVRLNNYKEIGDFALVIRGEHDDLEWIDENYKYKCIWYWEPPLWHWIKRIPSSFKIFCSSKVSQEAFEKRGYNSYWIPQACYPPIHKPYRKVNKDIDILYIGTNTQFRNSILKDLSKSFRVKAYGQGFGKEVYNQEFAKAVARSKICLELPPDTSPNYQLDDENNRHFSVRPFLYMAMGGFLVMPYNIDFLSLFKHFYYPTYREGISDQELAAWLHDNDMRETIIEQMRMQVLDKHTYENRLRRLIRIMGL